MRIVSGYFYDLITGFQKLLDLREDLAQEFREDMDQAVSIAKEKALAEHEAKVQKWEEDKKAVLDKRESQLAKNKKVRNGIGLALILGLLAYPGILLIGRRFVDVETPPTLLLEALLDLFLMALIVLRCGLPIFFVVGAITYLGMLLSYNSNKKQQPIMDPKPEVYRKHFDSEYGIMGELGHWWYILSSSSRFAHMGENYGSKGEEMLVDMLANIVPSNYICLIGALVDKSLDADVILIGNNGIWILESKYYSGKIILKNDEWYRHKTFFEPGGYQNSKSEYLDDFNKQWQREKRAVVKTLENSGFSNDICKMVTGGIVFTHPDAILSINESPKINVGDMSSWAHKISESIFEKNNKIVLNDDEIMRIADALLARSEKLNTGEKISLVDYAQDRYKSSKLNIVMFLEEHKPELEAKDKTKQ